MIFSAWRTAHSKESGEGREASRDGEGRECAHAKRDVQELELKLESTKAELLAAHLAEKEAITAQHSSDLSARNDDAISEATTTLQKSHEEQVRGSARTLATYVTHSACLCLDQLPESRAHRLDGGLGGEV